MSSAHAETEKKLEGKKVTLPYLRSSVNSDVSCADHYERDLGTHEGQENLRLVRSVVGLRVQGQPINLA